MGFGKGIFMKSWMKWAAVAAVGLVAVPVMGLSMLPSKTASKTAKPVAKVTRVSTSSTAKKTTLATKAVVKPVSKNISPRPASVRLGKNVVPTKTTKGHVSTPAHATLHSSKNLSTAKPVMMTKTPIRPTTLHSGPGKLPTPKSTLSKAMEKTHTPSSPMKSRPEMN
jgi:hypothetical protein